MAVVIRQVWDIGKLTSAASRADICACDEVSMSHVSQKGGI